MKKISLSCFIAVVALCVFSGCSPKQPEKDYTWLKQGIETAALQLKFTVAEIGDSSGCPVPSGRAMTRTFYVVSWIRNS